MWISYNFNYIAYDRKSLSFFSKIFGSLKKIDSKIFKMIDYMEIYFL